jgi:hypothetical protein
MFSIIVSRGLKRKYQSQNDSWDEELGINKLVAAIIHLLP